MPKKKNNRRKSKPLAQLKIARERIEILVNRAMEVSGERPDLSKRYFQLAKKIGMRYNVRLPPALKRKFCKKCFSYLKDGWRFRNGIARVTCKECGRVHHYPYRKK